MHQTNSSVLSPFTLEAEAAYNIWRDHRIAAYPQRLEEVVVEIGDVDALTQNEVASLKSSLGRANFVIYRLANARSDGRQALASLGAALGLQTLDANPYAGEDRLTLLSARSDAAAKGYIPYTNRALNWHTDGYYNPPDRQIRAFAMHCAEPAFAGGENGLIDHEMVYIALRDLNPALIAALMREDAMTIPANIEDGVELRVAQSGPVFSVQDGHLHMRYTARTRSIEWNDDADVQAARLALQQMLSGSNPWLFRFRLAAGEGLICNNVLHSRAAYEDRAPSKRAMFRARYYERASPYL